MVYFDIEFCIKIVLLEKYIIIVFYVFYFINNKFYRVIVFFVNIVFEV